MAEPRQLGHPSTLDSWSEGGGWAAGILTSKGGSAVDDQTQFAYQTIVARISVVSERRCELVEKSSMSEIDLLLLERNVSEGPFSGTRFGGLPSVDSNFSWPTCRACSGSMQFLGQIRRAEAKKLHLIFMCQNDPGVCSEWEADGGANAVICTDVDDLQIATSPSEGEVVRATLYGARVERVRTQDYGTARTEWAQQHPNRQREVLGHVGGEADWLQGDETPSCDNCKNPMRLVAQLETGPDYKTEMNFGGGCGYVFECDCTARGYGKFLWQS
jgi:hypothetical protein